MIKAAVKICRLLLVIATLSGISMTVFVALSAIMRYLVGKPFGFTEELVGLLFAALVFLAIPFVTVFRKQITITLISDLFPESVRRVLNAIGDLLVILYCAWFGFYAYEFAYFSFELGSSSDLSGLVLWPWMSLMVVSSVFVAIASVLLILNSKAINQYINKE